ncbi:hypothetical protein E2C01_044951 [Portunus trituberculatus]|uniref:Uncharacterized protein n=1 Tax=Portunus trituberculatus TaxID=210409 RepID=A0A5B7FWY5_PORTR|nr:hypothetical protein [Portunus trituberculatus]
MRRKCRTMLFLRQRRITWLRWTGGAHEAAGRERSFVYSQVDGRSTNSEEINLFLVGTLSMAPALELDVASTFFLYKAAVIEPFGVGQIHPQTNFYLKVKDT